MFDGWAIGLNGVLLVDGCNDSQATWDELGCFDMTVLDVLTDTPDGLDLPDERTEDVVYYQRDGEKHFSDFYTARTVTLVGTVGPVDPCACADPADCDCVTVREQVNELVQAFKRQCCDTEMVLYPPCTPSDDPLQRIFTGPYGMVGRPRRFKYKWDRYHQTADFVAEFRGVDQRLYVLDECGTPGYGECVQIDPGAELFSICAADGICAAPSGVCLTTPVTSDDSVAPTVVEVGGTEKVFPEIVLYPPLIRPYIQNITTGEYIQLDGTITDSPVTINTENGTAFDGDGNSLTHLLRGSLFLSMYPGNYLWRLLAADETTDGYATLCFRDTVVSG